jgi:drug/metabolite transporter (DMT)-like permease
MSGPDWAWMAVLCVTGAFGHWLLIKVYEVAEASAVQPFAYFQLVFASAMGMLVFGERLDPAVALGAAIIVAAGLFTFARARKVSAPSSPR